jgi:hypothetical protein
VPWDQDGLVHSVASHRGQPSIELEGCRIRAFGAAVDLEAECFEGTHMVVAVDDGETFDGQLGCPLSSVAGIVAQPNADGAATVDP